MELDDLRRRWQQQPSGSMPSPESTEQLLHTMLQQRTQEPIAQLKANIRRGNLLIISILLLNVFNFLRTVEPFGSKSESRYPLLILMGGVVAFLLFVLLQRWQLMRAMEVNSANLYQQLKTTSAKLRQLLLTARLMAVGLLTAVIGSFLYANRGSVQELLDPTTPHWRQHVLAWIVGTVVCVGLIIGLLRVGKIKQQRQYGQYLDQMDAALRELADEKH
ncbi:hypothetical protein [Hymenobacter sp. GOD-10R]|uniref:hypothetical protein n=1 Tax=Hymenobacter sp. GOD-10R TaxID=3093922 RepID=UPI002D7A2F46|nr:hypothetical protein [Hymenobacter sp. GOD-10R]WRQ27431.1 hypothetical protein SD425_20380 [Hymenobacter sp. GOD-10R]